jgi:hypothetical protein
MCGCVGGRGWGGRGCGYMRVGGWVFA